MHYDDMVIMLSPHELYDGGMMRQQRHLLLWRIRREQGQISLTLGMMLQE